MTAPESRERVEAAAARLRRHLAQPGAFARLSPLGCGRVALYRSGGGATLGAGFVPKEAADTLAARGDAVWTGQGEGRRLHAAQTSPEPRPAIVPAMIDHDGRSETVMLHTGESPLLWLHRRPGRDGKPQISDEEFAAGERFRADWTLARLTPRTTMNWDASLAPDGRGSGSRGPAAASDSALAARQRV
ncbi:DUF6456 domain-containing protein, partial [Bosea sp. (in: a-proteobacteria)]|uniref:DUF6456 domain-containing protein n=1 Tax=Bosea sp. (in: a-proteobacteria) TaxID=1871050 RepID=UPI00273317FB